MGSRRVARLVGAAVAGLALAAAGPGRDRGSGPG